MLKPGIFPNLKWSLFCGEPLPAQSARYRERSPLFSAARLTDPLAIFQGSEDKVVPPNQAQEMADALRRQGLPVALIMFEGEQHGFRRAENVARALDAEFFFFSKILVIEFLLLSLFTYSG